MHILAVYALKQVVYCSTINYNNHYCRLTVVSLYYMNSGRRNTCIPFIASYITNNKDIIIPTKSKFEIYKICSSSLPPVLLRQWISFNPLQHFSHHFHHLLTYRLYMSLAVFRRNKRRQIFDAKGSISEWSDYGIFNATRNSLPYGRQPATE